MKTKGWKKEDQLTKEGVQDKATAKFWGEILQKESFPAENIISSNRSQILGPDMLQEGISANEGQRSEVWGYTPKPP